MNPVIGGSPSRKGGGTKRTFLERRITGSRAGCKHHRATNSGEVWREHLFRASAVEGLWQSCPVGGFVVTHHLSQQLGFTYPVQQVVVSLRVTHAHNDGIGEGCECVAAHCLPFQQLDDPTVWCADDAASHTTDPTSWGEGGASKGGAGKNLAAAIFPEAATPRSRRRLSTAWLREMP